MQRHWSSAPNPRAAAAEDLWLRCVARELAGEQVDFEALCNERPELAAELRELRAAWQTDANAAAPAPRTPPASIEVDAVDALVRRLAAPATRAERYRDDGEIARGGMGAVHRVWDGDLNRALALKVLRIGGPASAHATLRFLEEAQVTAQLDHPGIVPVHEIGVDASGRPFFAMKLVEGSDLRRVFELAWTEAEGWNTTRVLGVLLKVCEALGYAHEKGVIHRDLKPSNVMVGRFGEVYVMDWGVARVLARGERRSEPGTSSIGAVATVRSAVADTNTDSSLLTSDGEVIGTAAYMSPEQARGELDRLSPRSDVYALGAMLYQLLAREMPYASDAKTTAQVLDFVLRGPPRPLASFDTRAAPELVAICSKAMAREPEQRYANLSEVAEDLRAYLEGRVVRAHATGVWTSARKWTRRNRALAASLATILVAAAIGAWQTRRSSVVRADFERLTRLRQPTEMLADYDALWPASSSNLPELERWLALAEDAASHLDNFRAQLAELRARALPWDQMSPTELRLRRQYDADTQRARRLITFLLNQRADLQRTRQPSTWDGSTLDQVEDQILRDGPVVEVREAKRVARHVWTFSTTIDQLMHDRLVTLIPEIERVSTQDRGYSCIQRVRRAIEFVRDGQHADANEVASAWDEACASIRDRTQCPMYDGLELKPQVGLLPIGRDPCSGLWEFAHLQSGTVPERDATGHLAITAESGIVLVLLPGAHYEQGTPRQRDRPSFDPYAEWLEYRTSRVELDPFFVAKFEVTVAQLSRWTGQGLESLGARPPIGAGDPRMLPTCSLSWWDYDRTARELGLALPTEAQWEYAARAGGSQPWSTTGAIGELHWFANLFDPDGQAHLADPDLRADGGLARDGYPSVAPVGSFLPNAFGLYDTLGNVAEPCSDIGALDYATPRWLGTGARASNYDQGMRVARGGHSGSDPMQARVGSRYVIGPSAADSVLGLRPVRPIDL